MASDGLKKAIRRLARRPTDPPLNLSPISPFDAVLEERMRQLERQVEGLRQWINGLLVALVAAVVAEIVLSLIG